MRGLLENETHQVIALGVFVVCVVIATGFGIVWIHSDRPCPAGCEYKVSKPEAHSDLCRNCGVLIYTCIHPNAHRTYCDGCGMLYYTCEKLGVKPEEQQSYQHRVVGAGGPNEHYACSRPRENSSVRISDK